MDSGLAPIISMLYLSRIPEWNNSRVAFRAVCPPIVGRIASGFSILIIFSITFFSIGSMYVESAIIGSVIIVAGLELINITLMPSSLRALHA